MLLMDRGGKHLSGIPVREDRQRLREFSVNLMGGGVVAEAALQRRLAFIVRDGNPLGVTDEQLLRILKCDAFVCIPLSSRSRSIGVLVGGAARWQVEGLRKRERFLKSFGEQAGAAFETAFGEQGEVLASRRSRR